MTCAKTYAAAALSALFLFLLAPAALAQGVPSVDDAGGTVGDTTGGVTDTVGDTTGGVTDTVGDTTGGATDTIQDTTGGTTGTIQDTTDTVGGTTGGTTNTIEDTTKDTTDTVGGTTGGATETVGGVTGGSGSEPSGGGDGLNIPPVDDLAPGLINDILDEAEGLGLSPSAAEGWIEGKKILATASFETPRAALSSFSRVLESLLGTLAESTTAAEVSGLELSVEPQGDSFLESAGRIATEAAKALAFPLALALAVVGFLTVQGRIGRKDPKLVLAPVDATEETLIFE